MMSNLMCEVYSQRKEKQKYRVLPGPNWKKITKTRVRMTETILAHVCTFWNMKIKTQLEDEALRDMKIKQCKQTGTLNSCFRKWKKTYLDKRNGHADIENKHSTETPKHKRSTAENFHEFYLIKSKKIRNFASRFLKKNISITSGIIKILINIVTVIVVNHQHHHYHHRHYRGHYRQ